MIVEIKGTGSHNKGAEMMLLSIIQELQTESADLKLVVAPQRRSCEYAFFSKLGLHPKLSLELNGFQLGHMGQFIPKKLRRIYGIVLDSEVDCVLDASGFAYSDQWGPRPARMMAKYTKQWKKSGTKVILMPQAFGPFQNENIIPHVKAIIENSDMIYARDPSSYNALVEIADDEEKIRLAPDFTVLLEGITPDYFNEEEYQICIVPNKRMTDKLSEGSDYIDFMIKAIGYVQDHGLKPFFLIHGGQEDLALANVINMRLSRVIPVLNEANSILIKGIIKSSKGLIGSRYHSLASALYSGTVCVGTGWSHKYSALFADFDFEEGFCSLSLSDEQLYERLNVIIDDDLRSIRREGLLSLSGKHRERSIKMFNEVRQYIGLAH